MVKVAIVGATSHVAGYLIPAIAEKHEVVTLTRKPSNPEVHLPNIHRYSHLPNVHSVVVDYSKPAALDAALQGVHTVISTIFNFDKDAYVNTSLALLESALRVGVKRFAPSEFAAHGLPNDTIEVYRYKAIVSEAVRKSGIEYTLFDTGFWMNMLAAGTPGANGMAYTPIFDVGNCSARIPGDGSAYLVYIRGEDMAKFVAASLELEKWPAVSRMVGDRKTFNEILRIAEEVRGKKFDVTYVTLEELRAQVAADPSQLVLNAQAQMYIEMLVSDRWGGADASLNDLCPEVKPMGIEEFLQIWWGSA